MKQFSNIKPIKQTAVKYSAVIMIICALVSLCSCSGNKRDLSNPNADGGAKRVYEMIKSAEGRYTLSGQQESTWMGSEDYEFEYIQSASGRLPAIRGFDYMNDDFDGVNERAVKWAQQGGLVTICWHTGADFSGEWADAQNDEITDWDRALTPGTEEYETLINGMDKGAKALKDLQNKGVTVIWRPFHEFDGGWFWWGKGGNKNFIKLWRIMYERYTEYWELNNLIWVLGYSHNGEDYRKWNPGSDYYDIVGADSYDGGAMPELYKEVKKVNLKGKPVCFHECGANPTAEEFTETPWVWFMTWHTEYLTDNNSPETLKELYNSDRVITLDELDILKAGN